MPRVFVWIGVAAVVLLTCIVGAWFVYYKPWPEVSYRVPDGFTGLIAIVDRDNSDPPVPRFGGQIDFTQGPVIYLDFNSVSGMQVGMVAGSTMSGTPIPLGVISEDISNGVEGSPTPEGMIAIW